MRVLHFYKVALPDSIGGVETVIHQLSLGSVRLGHQVDVLAMTRGGKPRVIDFAGYKVHLIPQCFEWASTPLGFSIFSAFKKLALEADIIHYHYPWPLMDLAHLFLIPKRPSLVSYHSDIVKQSFLKKIYSPVQNMFLREMDFIVASTSNYFLTSHVLNKFSSKVKIIPYGIEDFFEGSVQSGHFDSWKAVFPNPFFFFVGVLRYYKGLKTLVEASKETGLTVVIAGDGPEASSLRAYAKKIGAAQVFFVGKISDEDKAVLLNLCLALVFPSDIRSESFGLTLVEGLMFSKPLISCEIGTGTSFINLANETGFVIPPGDKDALGKAMQYLYDRPKLAIVLGLNGRERFKSHFNSGAMVKGYMVLYEQMMRDGNSLKWA